MLFKDEMRISLMQTHHSIFLLLLFKNLIVLLILLGINLLQNGKREGDKVGFKIDKVENRT